MQHPLPVAAFFLIFMIFEPLFLCENGKRNRAVIWKTAATLMAAAVAAFSFSASPDTFCLLILLGVLVSALSDAVIHFTLGAGALAFMAAHGCFIAAFLLRAPVSLPFTLALFVLATGGAILLFRPHFDKIGKMLPLCLVYVAILSSMFSLGFPLAFTAGTRAIPLTIGALLFFVSDLLVAKNVFLSTSLKSEAAAMTTYYGAEFLFALSAYLVAF